MGKKNGVTEPEKTVVATAEAALPAEYAGTWGAGESTEASDILLPKIFLMQGMSDLVSAGDARPGEFRDSITGELLTDDKGNLDVAVFHSFKTWQIFKAVGGNKEFDRREDYTVENANAPYNWREGGVDYHRDKVFHFYCLLPSKIDDLPYVLSLSRTSTQGAKQLATIFAKLQRMKQPSAAVVVTLTAVKQQNDKGTFYVVNAKQSRRSTTAELAACRSWYDEIRASQTKYKVDEEDKPVDVTPPEVHAAAEVLGGTVSYDDDDIPF